MARGWLRSASWRRARGSGPREELDLRDLRRRTDTHRRSPVARPLADVDLRALEAMQSRDEWLLKANGEVPREHLTAVGMTGELEVHAELVGELDPARLMREQHAGPSRVASGKRLRQIGAVASAVAARRVIIDAGEIEPGVAANSNVLVAQRCV